MNSRSTNRKRNFPTTSDEQENKENVENIKKKKTYCLRSRKVEETTSSPTFKITQLHLPLKSVKNIVTSVASHSRSKNKNEGLPNVEQSMISTDTSSSFASTSSDLQVHHLGIISGTSATMALEIQCLICKDTEESNNVEYLVCGHSFHSVCMQKWLHLHDSCPICMRDISMMSNSVISIDEDILDFSEVQCAICLDTVESSDFQIIACDHRFHVLCIQTWFGVKDVCPICVGSNVFEDDSVYEPLEGRECTICMNTEVSSDFQYLECDHSFHTMCIQTWFQINKSCPICMPSTHSINTSNIFEEEVYDECVICMGTEENSDFQLLSSCNHRFHSLCLQTWFQVNKSCPICMPIENSATNVFKEQNHCTICMGVEGSSEFETISCNPLHNIWHTFHSKCIEIWFQNNDSCPGCMPDISINNSQLSPLNLKEEQDSEIIRCAICVDTEESTDFEFISCCHSFHSFCIQNWLKVKQTCPICNTVISKNNNSTT